MGSCRLGPNRACQCRSDNTGCLELQIDVDD